MENESVEQVIRERRTVRSLSNQSISTDVLYELLETASYAPYHSKEEPWHVGIVANEQERRVFVDKIMESYDRLDIWSSYDPQYLTKAKKRTRDYFLDVPVTLIVTAPICDNKLADLEAVSAVSAFIQNFQLAAWSKRIGVTWRTIPVIMDAVFKEEIGIEKQRQIIGLLDVTVIDDSVKLPTGKRTPVKQWTRRLSENLPKSG